MNQPKLMGFPKPAGLFTKNVVRTENPRRAPASFASQAAHESGEQSPRSVFRAPREPELPKPVSFKP